MVATGDTGALTLRHIRRHCRHPFPGWLTRAQGRKPSAPGAPDRRHPLLPKRPFAHIPAKIILLLAGGAIALASFAGAPASGAVHQPGDPARADQPATPVATPTTPAATPTAAPT